MLDKCNCSTLVANHQIAAVFQSSILASFCLCLAIEPSVAVPSLIFLQFCLRVSKTTVNRKLGVHCSALFSAINVFSQFVSVECPLV